ncbi:MAG TPA: tetratricopeptide repeat protein [bacterium]|nr:tetratricopeptide repeat protein [bacterium]
MKLLVVFATCLLLILACGGKTTQQKQADRNLALLQESTADPDFAKGRALVMEEKYAEALPILEKSAAPEALFYRALALQGMGKADDAAGLFAVCIQNNIQPAESLYNIGLIAYEKGDKESAAARMTDVIAKEPDHAGAHYFLAGVAYEKNDMATAETHFRAAAKSSPRNGAAWEGLFYALVSQDKFAEGWELRDKLDLTAGDDLANILLVGEKIGKAAEALALIPAGEMADAVKLQRIVLIAQIQGLAAALAEADKLPKELTAQAGFTVLDRGAEGTLEWLVSKMDDGKVMLTCTAGKEAKPALHELAVTAAGVTVNKKNYPADTFRAAIPGLCKKK